MKMSQMFKTTLAAAMIMALAVTAGCGGGGDICRQRKGDFETGSQFANGTSAGPGNGGF